MPPGANVVLGAANRFAVVVGTSPKPEYPVLPCAKFCRLSVWAYNCARAGVAIAKNARPTVTSSQPCQMAMGRPPIAAENEYRERVTTGARVTFTMSGTARLDLKPRCIYMPLIEDLSSPLPRTVLPEPNNESPEWSSPSDKIGRHLIPNLPINSINYLRIVLSNAPYRKLFRCAQASSPAFQIHSAGRRADRQTPAFKRSLRRAWSKAADRVAAVFAAEFNERLMKPVAPANSLRVLRPR